MNPLRSVRFGLALVTILASCNLILDNELRPSGDADSASGGTGVGTGGGSGDQTGAGGVAGKGGASGEGGAAGSEGGTGEGGGEGTTGGASGEGGATGEGGGGTIGQCRPGDEGSCSFVDPTLLGNCANGKVTCDSDGNWGDCDVTPGEDSCLVAGDDADCDGMPNSGCECVDGDTQPCGVDTDVGICDFGLSTCASQAWGPCEGAVTREARDCRSTQDNDCDGFPDNTLDETCKCVPDSSESCNDEPRAGVGICRASTRSCVSSSDISSTAWGDCTGGVHPGAELCNANNQDEDCDAMTNEGCACISGTTQSCGNCNLGLQTCVGGAWGDCSGQPGPPVTYYPDLDHDTYGDTSQATTNCSGPPTDYVTRAGDCCDADGRVHIDAGFLVAGDGGCGRGGDFDCDDVVEYLYTAIGNPQCCSSACSGGWVSVPPPACGARGGWLQPPTGVCSFGPLDQQCR